jgi:hypothetical protein
VIVAEMLFGDVVAKTCVVPAADENKHDYMYLSMIHRPILFMNALL